MVFDLLRDLLIKNRPDLTTPQFDENGNLISQVFTSNPLQGGNTLKQEQLDAIFPQITQEEADTYNALLPIAQQAAGLEAGDPRLVDILPTPNTVRDLITPGQTLTDYYGSLGYVAPTTAPSQPAPATPPEVRVRDPFPSGRPGQPNDGIADDRGSVPVNNTPTTPDPVPDPIAINFLEEARKAMGPFLPPTRFPGMSQDAYDTLVQAAFGDWQNRLATEQDRLRTEQENAVQRARTAQLIGDASGSFRNSITDLLLAQGLDPTRFSGGIDRALQDITASIDPLDKNPQQYFTGASDVVANITNQQRGFDIDQFTRQYSEVFPQFFETSERGFQDTFDDPFINNFLNTRYDEASGILDNARARGSINDTGFEKALSELGNQRTAAQSDLQLIGGDILNLNRGELRSVADQAFDAIGNYNFGDFSFDPFVQRADEKRNDLAGRFEGDFLSQVNNLQFFNPESALSLGGQAQGAINSFSPSPTALNVIRQREEDKRNSGRGVGSQGSF